MKQQTNDSLTPKTVSAPEQPPPGFQCRTDNGRCFQQGGWEALTGKAIVVFTDGSIYKFGPIDEQEWIETFRDALQPGCAWNSSWKDLPPTHWEKLSSYPPGLDHQF